MSDTMTPGALVPGPDCARYASVLPVLAQGGADAATLASARAHIVGCAYCASQLAAYDALDAALARQYGGSTGSPAMDVAAIMRLADLDEPPEVLLDDLDEPPEETRTRHAHAPRRPTRRLADLAGIAAAILIVIAVVALLLSHTGFSRQAGPRKATPAPSVTAPAQPTVSATTGPAAALSFASVHMVSPAVGWAATNDGLERTTDGGVRWTRVTPQRAQLSVSPPLDVISGSEAWVADGQSPCARIWHTTDGGQSWAVSSIPRSQVQTGAMPICSAPTFVDAQHGWMMESLGAAAGSEGVAIFRTADGGQTWSETSDAMYTTNAGPGALPFGGDKTGIAFVNASTGWVTGTSPAPGTWLYVTHDGGKTWSQQTLPLPAGVTVPGQAVTHPPVFFSSTYGVLPVDFQSQASKTYFYVTHDAGQTWTPTQAVPSGQWSLADASHWWVVSGNTLYLSTDEGQSWMQIEPNAVFNNVTSLDMVSADVGFAIDMSSNSGTGGLIKTTDGGHTWTNVDAVSG